MHIFKMISATLSVNIAQWRLFGDLENIDISEDLNEYVFHITLYKAALTIKIQYN